MRTLMIIGPRPPPVGGGTVSVQLLLDELEKYASIQAIAINTSTYRHAQKANLFKYRTMVSAVPIVKQYTKNIKSSDAVLVIATRKSIFTLGSFLLPFARTCHIPIYLKPLGGAIGKYLSVQKKLIRRYMIMVLKAATGVMVQTKQLQTELAKLGVTNTYHIPGYRPAISVFRPTKKNQGDFRLLFLSQIAREKGPLLLLEALRTLRFDDSVSVVCDFYGPLIEKDRRDFLRQLKATPGAQYCGMLEVGKASKLMLKYDALAFPTYRSFLEGHPGVIIEAMQAGIPVISTRYPTVTELISNGENGLLVAVGDCRALALAIKRLALDHPLRDKMGKANYQRGKEFRSDLVVSRMLEFMLPGSINLIP